MSEVSAYIHSAFKFAIYQKKIQPDCIISFLPNTNLIVLLARKFFGLRTPIICSDRNLLTDEVKRLPLPELRAACIHSLYHLAARHIAASTAVKIDLHKNFNIKTDQITVIPNGVNYEQISRKSRELLSIDFSDRTGTKFVAVGRLSIQKGFDILLDAFSQLTDLRWHLDLVGTGEEEGNLKKQTVELGISKSVTFHGWLSNPYPLFIHSDCFILSSRWEGMPNVLLEALSLGVPAISTRCAGADEILENSDAGLLVDPDSVESLSNGIRSFIQSSDEKKSSMSYWAYQRSLDYGFDQTVRKYKDLISTCLS